MRRSTVPVLVLTVRDAVEDRVAGLDLGADDYITKPFHLSELEARVRALIRRAHARGEARTSCTAALRLDMAGRRLFCDDEPLDLSARELAVLELLLLREGKVVTKQQIVDTSTAGRTCRRATRSRSSSTACAGSSRRPASTSAPCAAWATSSRSRMAS